MAYFLPSSIQKRLLRYALSRLEFLDTDALDLGNLEIGWGRKSTVELKDVALRKAKLSALLNLPSHLSIEDATVALLRLTVPADLHTASITVEIQGVDARARLLEEETRDVSTGATQTDTKNRQRQNRTKKTRARSPSRKEHLSHKYGFPSNDDLDTLPTTHDLAASFLAEEPEEEKEQLEAAINSQSTDLRHSVASSENGDDALAYGDDSVAYGTGVGLSLPAFLADFLKGIVDRLQVMVSGLSIKLDVSMDSSLDDISRLSETANLSETTVGLHIEAVKVYPAGDPEAERIDIQSQPKQAASPLNEREIRVGQRCVSISGISGSLVSDAATFAQLSQVFDSSANDGSLSQETTGNAESGPPNFTKSSQAFSSPGDVDDKGTPEPESPTQQQAASEQRKDSEDNVEAQLLNAQAFSDSFGDSLGPVAEALVDSMDEHSFGSSRSQSPEEIYEPQLESQPSPSIYTHSALKRFREERLSSSDHKAQQLHESRQKSTEFPTVISPLGSKSPSIEMPGTFQEETTILSTSSLPRAVDIPVDKMTDSQENISRISSEDELAESMVFSHDEAESIYMSALQGEDSRQFRTTSHWDAPGAWGNQSISDFSLHTRSNEPEALQPSLQELERQPSASLSRTTEQTLKSSSSLRYDEGLKSGTKPEKSATGSTPPSPSQKVSVKPLFHVTECRIWLPQSGTEDLGSEYILEQDPSPKSPDVLTRSEHQTIPGAYSTYAESHSSSLRGSRKIDPSEGSFQPHGLPEQRANHKGRGIAWLELSLSFIKARTDSFTSRLLVHLARKIQSTFSAINTPTSEKTERKNDSGQKLTSRTGLKINLNSLEVLFAEAVADRTFDSLSLPSAYPTVFENSSEKALFRLSLRDLSVETPDMESLLSLRLEVGQLNFGFADEDILSFSRETRLRTSLRDVREVRDKDISVEINQINGTREVHLATQPIKITVNLQKIDNTLGSIGGLSSLLELGSSIASDSTVVSPTPKAQPRSRTVRFDSSTKPSPQQSHDLQARVNIKVSGAYISVQGAQCKIACHSSAIKVVARSTLIGLQIDDLRLSGPHLRYSADQAPFMVRLRDIRVKYLFAPEEHDLTRLISLLTPSKDKFEDDDDFLVDTLVRQRKKGSVLRFTVSQLSVDCENLQAIDSFRDLSTEMSKMSAVTKFLPKETRPGLLTLGIINNICVRAQTGLKIGHVCVELGSTEVALVSAPSLVALAIGKIEIESEDKEKYVTPVLPENCNAQQPMLMTRMIEDELEPSVKIKLWNTTFEYSVPLLMAIMDRDERTIFDAEIAVDLAASIANLTERPVIQTSNTQLSYSSENPKSLKIDLALRECALGLNPRNMQSKALFAITDARFRAGLPNPRGFKLELELRKAGLLLTNDFPKLAAESEASSGRQELLPAASISQIDELRQKGFVCVTSISAATIILNFKNGAEEESSAVDVELKDKLFVLETCADSTQTLIETLNDLMPPIPPSKGQKYRTEVAPVEDMMASFTGDAFVIPSRDGLSKPESATEDFDYYDSNLTADFDSLGDIPHSDLELLSEDVDGDLGDDFTTDPGELDEFTGPSIDVPITKTLEREHVSGSFAPGRLPTQVQGTANKWDSANNRYVPVKKSELTSNPLKVRVRDTHVIWNLYDGYDWEQTRDTISKAVQDVEVRAAERRQGKRNTLEEDEDEESVIGDFLFNSIYIGVPLNHDPKDLSRQINRNIDDLVSETASHTPSHTSAATSRPTSSHRNKPHARKLKLNRSRRHKIAFELRGVSVDFFVFPPGDETQSSTDVRVDDFEIFDHVPTSTWKKFATYMHDAGPREDNKPMLHLEICDVRPVPELTATELVIRATILPLRLHVDQDALDFITRFFEFNDDGKSNNGAPAEQPYLQRVEVRPVPVKLDYKPKKIDYAGLRSGRTTEFMNFFILDGADFVLKHVVVYGTSGFMKLHRSLEDVWMPDVKMNQLPSVLSGLNGVRTFVNVGTGVRDLIAIPIREYRKDGRIVRSISKGAMAFAKTTGSELTKFGAKVAIGAQTALQGAEGIFAQPNQTFDAGWEEMDLDPDEKRAISHYANQPTGILQGLKGAARSLERDLLVTRDIIVAISGEVRESSSAKGAALAVARHAPTLILRPMIGATKAISQTLMGATNTVDPQNKRRIDDKYKRY